MIAGRSTRIGSTACHLALVLVLGACGKDDPAGPERVPRSLTAHSSVAVTAPVGTVLPAGASVIVRDQHGEPFPGVAVTFTPGPGGGTVETSAVKTDGNGVASSGTWTLGTAMGNQRLVARVARLDSVEFIASAAPGAPTTLEILTVGVPTATVGRAVTGLPAVVLRDKYRNPIAGAAVEFAVRTGGGTATGLEAVTNASGVAMVGGWTLGIRSGPQTLRAQVANLPEVVLTANAVAGPTEVLALVAGIDGITQTGRALGAPPVISARDVYENPVAGRALSVRVIQGGGSIATSVVTDDAGLARLSGWTLGPSEGLNAVAVEVDGLPALTVYAKAVPASSYDIEYRYLTEASESQRQAFARAADRWRKVIIGDLPSVPAPNTAMCGLTGTPLTDAVDDLLIYIELVKIDGPGKVLGSAGPCSIRSQTGLTHVGIMRFDIDDVLELEAGGRFEDVVLHEVGHILGIGTLWTNHGFLMDRGGADPFYMGTAGRAAFALAGGSAYLGAHVPVENSGGPGTRDGHWRESVLNSELMTGFVEPRGFRMPLSLMTIGSLEDMGYRITTWGDDAYFYYGPSSSQAGISASRASAAGQDRELIEVPLPPPQAVTETGQLSTISPRVSRSATATARVAQTKPRPVQQLEVRRRR